MSKSEQPPHKEPHLSRHDATRLAELTHRSVHGQLTAHEHAEFQERLLTDAAARQKYFLLLDLEYGLAQIAAEETGRQAVCLPAASLLPVAPPSAVAESRRTKAILWLAVAVALTGLLLSPLAFRMVAPFADVAQQEDAPPPESADETPAGMKASESSEPEMVLVQSARSRFFGEPRAPAAGDALKLFHDYALVEGTVQLRSRTGAEMIVQAPAVFAIEGADRVMLKVGDVSVYAPEGAEGFRVLTPQAEVVDIGTRFSISIDETGDAAVEVVEGAAEVFAKTANRRDDNRTDQQGPAAQETDAAGLLLEAGEGRQIDSLGNITPRPQVAMGKSYQAELPDRLVDYRVSPNNCEHPNCLEQVTVQRDGKLHVYQASELIGFDLIHFKAGGNSSNLSTPLGVYDPPKGDGSRTRAAFFDRGTDLAAGALNPGGSEKPLRADPNMDDADLQRRTPGMAVRFHQPVINGPGPDVVFFDLHVVVHPEKGDPFHVSPTHFEPGLRSHTIFNYDISLANRAAHQLTGFRLYRFPSRIESLEQLLTSAHSGGYEHVVPAKAIATGIDLSDLGYPPGAEVAELFFQDALDDDNQIDPVFIGGLPPTP